MPKKIVVKVSIACDKCKTCIMKAVAKLDGVNTMALDAEKNTLTIVGDADPVLIIKQLRKDGKAASIESVGPADPKPEEKKPDEKKPCSDPCYYPCQPVCVPPGYIVYDEPTGCTIV